MKLWSAIRFSQLLFCIIFCVFQSAAQGTQNMQYTVKPGETLSLLAKRYHTTVGDIMRLNGMNTKSILRVGEKIKIPAPNEKVLRSAAVKQVAAADTTSRKNCCCRQHCYLSSCGFKR